MAQRRRWLLWILIFIVTIFVGMRIYFRATDDFRISNIMYDMPYHPEWEIAPLTNQDQALLDTILNQKFHYIGKGAQSYVFGSDDQKYVIKFFKFKHLRPSLFVDLLPDVSPFSDYKQRVKARKQRKLNGVFAGYKLAYDLDKDNSGLIFIQLNPSHKNKEITVIDKIGLERTINVGDVPFIIQEKGETLRNVLRKLMENEDISTTKRRIGQIFDLYIVEYSKGIFDHDHGVMHNAGFVGERPIHLDVGKMHYDESIRLPEVYQEDLLKIGGKMKDWFNNNYPKHAEEIIQDIENKLSKISNRRIQLYEANPE